MALLGNLFSSVKVTKALYKCHEIKHPWVFNKIHYSDVHFVLVVKDSVIIKNKKYPQGLMLSLGDMYVIFDDEAFSLHSTESIHAVVVTGSFDIDVSEKNPILSMLPRTIRLKLNQSDCYAMKSMFELMSNESASDNIGSQSIANKICEIFFIQVFRNYTLTQKKDNTGWLAGILDENLKNVIKEVHAHIEKHWTVESMAEIAGMSRSAFALKFKSIMGKSPLEYLTEWRVHKAGILLNERGATVSEVAHKVGYESESAFNRVFKEKMGKTPGEYKRAKALMMLMLYSYAVTDTVSFL